MPYSKLNVATAPLQQLPSQSRIYFSTALNLGWLGDLLWPIGCGSSNILWLRSLGFQMPSLNTAAIWANPSVRVRDHAGQLLQEPWPRPSLWAVVQGHSRLSDPLATANTCRAEMSCLPRLPSQRRVTNKCCCFTSFSLGVVCNVAVNSDTYSFIPFFLVSPVPTHGLSSKVQCFLMKTLPAKPASLKFTLMLCCNSEDTEIQLPPQVPSPSTAWCLGVHHSSSITYIKA